jgi:hypothetical protein
MEIEKLVKDEDLLRAAFDVGHDGPVGLCELVSRRHGLELTLEQAEAVMEHAEDCCEYHLTELNEEGYCDPVSSRR